MKYWHYWVVLIGVLFALTCADAQDHPFTVRDDIAMVRFSDPFPGSGVPGSDIVRRSPDGRHFVVVTTKGILGSNLLESQILLFSVDQVKALVESEGTAPRAAPRVIATVTGSTHYEESRPYAPVIKDLRWSPDLQCIYFEGENAAGAYQLYSATVDGAGFQALTPSDYSVDRYDVGDNTIVYTASLINAVASDAGSRMNDDALDVTGFSLQDILFGKSTPAVAPETFSLWRLKNSHGVWASMPLTEALFRDQRYFSYLLPFKLSPRGDSLIQVTPLVSVPSSWKAYNPAPGFEHLRLTGKDPRLTSDTNLWRPQQYSLVNIATGKLLPLVDAPNARTLAYLDVSKVVWAEDESRVLVTNTFLPLEQSNSSADSPRRYPCAVASVSIPLLNAQCLVFRGSQAGSLQGTDHVVDVRFGATVSEAIVLVETASGNSEEHTYRFRNSQWSLMSSAPASSGLSTVVTPHTAHDRYASDIELFVKQDLNSPPTLYARDAHSGKEMQVWDPNPQFAHIQFGVASVYHWTDQTGREWTGGLVKPVDYKPGQRYPLIVQMYMFYEGQFITDGTDPTAFAARELASMGFVVLQIQKKPDTLTDADPQVALDGYKSAIEHLSESGMVDPRKVGAVGFSWTCWYVEYALVNAPKLFAAATVADGLDNSYINYHLFGEGSRPIQQQMERIHSGAPFGAGLARWFNAALGFHLDRVEAPLRIEAIDPVSLLSEWELYSSLRMQGKAVDLIYFPEGTHIHQKPQERFASQEGNIDWLRFWLQDSEDHDPKKSGQYERWRRLRSDRDSAESMMR